MKTMPTQKEIRDNTNLLFQASQHGDLEDVQRLLPLFNQKIDDSEALRLAAANGHTECVKLLIPVSDPNDRYSLALQCAVMNNHIDIIKLLIPVSDYHLALNKLVNFGNHDTTLFQQCIEEHEALQQKERLTDSIEHISPPHYSVKRKL